MDSFLDEPRNTPKPTPVIQDIEIPTVPEVSLMFQNARKNKSSPINFGKTAQSYNAWKLRSQPNNIPEYDSFLITNTSNKENVAQEKSFLSKKQVRFQSPVQKSANVANPMQNLLPPNLTANSIKNNPLQRLESLNISNENRFNTNSTSPINNKITAKPFEKLYTSSIPVPNKELDLSFLEPQKNPCTFARNESFTKPIINTPPLKAFNYNDQIRLSSGLSENTFQNNNSIGTSKKVVEDLKINSPKKVIETGEETAIKDKTVVESPSVNDLLAIIKLQNEQLQLLQNQVEKLVKLSEKSQETQNKVEKLEEKTIEHQETKDPSDGKKISVGLMTSFEVSFKPPASKKKNKMPNLPPVEDVSCNNNTTIDDRGRKQKSEIRRNDEQVFQSGWNCRKNNDTEYSLGSEESFEVREPPESPENSIHIDIQEYDTDSDDEDSSDAGWTFYKDILGQVNNLLENSSRPAYRPNKQTTNRNYVQERSTDTTLERIKQTAMKRLQNEGFLQSSSEQSALRPNEVSFAVKQILMKYLPDDGLADVVTRHKEERYKAEKQRKPTDISVKYTQQCNVVTNAAQYYGRKMKSGKNPQGKNKMSENPKILDITTLKQQPKLL